MSGCESREKPLSAIREIIVFQGGAWEEIGATSNWRKERKRKQAKTNIEADDSALLFYNQKLLSSCGKGPVLVGEQPNGESMRAVWEHKGFFKKMNGSFCWYYLFIGRSFNRWCLNPKIFIEKLCDNKFIEWQICND